MVTWGRNSSTVTSTNTSDKPAKDTIWVTNVHLDVVEPWGIFPIKQSRFAATGDVPLRDYTMRMRTLTTWRGGELFHGRYAEEQAGRGLIVGTQRRTGCALASRISSGSRYSASWRHGWGCSSSWRSAPVWWARRSATTCRRRRSRCGARAARSRVSASPVRAPGPRVRRREVGGLADGPVQGRHAHVVVAVHGHHIRPMLVADRAQNVGMVSHDHRLLQEWRCRPMVPLPHQPVNARSAYTTAPPPLTHR